MRRRLEAWVPPNAERRERRSSEHLVSCERAMAGEGTRGSLEEDKFARLRGLFGSLTCCQARQDGL